jgi:DNA-directed RNA polymerase specialized sigma24 family protein
VAAGTSHTTISIKLNEQGFHDIFNKYYVTLCLFANQYTENQETSADIVQDSFATLYVGHHCSHTHLHGHLHCDKLQMENQHPCCQ